MLFGMGAGSCRAGVRSRTEVHQGCAGYGLHNPRSDAGQGGMESLCVIVCGYAYRQDRVNSPRWFSFGILPLY